VTSLIEQSAVELLAAMEAGECSSAEVVSACLERIRARDGEVGAFLDIDEERALETAKEIDRRRVAGESLGPLAGLPVGIKDNICTRGWKTTCASRMLENFTPVYDAHVTEKLLAADAVLIGRLNMDEFAMGSSCENSAFQLTRNPHHLEHATGGSSGGCAAAVADRMIPLSVGSDTGGSIRQPAALCGVVGVKPTYGRVSRYGLVAFASSLDQIGPFARSVPDAALLLNVLAGHDRRDSTSVDRPVPDYLEGLDAPLEGLRIGIVPDHFGDGLHDEVEAAVRSAIEVYRQLGAEVHEVEMPHARYGVAAYYLIAPSEASSNLARYDGVHYGHRAASFENMIDMYERTRGEGFGPEVKRRIMLGTYALSSGYYDAYYLKALKVRRLIAQDYARAFEQVDVILSPTSPTPAFKIGELIDDPLKMYLNDVYTINANLAGIPGISLPCGESSDGSGSDGSGSNGLPIGLQLLAPAFEEQRLLRAARMFERRV
jgi:aspartyl-tRNA(Asn)/glutamyl-tRNA(Gln) amidotransferase subunit A